jgi:hypothetical protein
MAAGYLFRCLVTAARCLPPGADCRPVPTIVFGLVPTIVFGVETNCSSVIGWHLPKQRKGHGGLITKKTFHQKVHIPNPVEVFL